MSDANTDTFDKELEVLQQIYLTEEEVHQRDLARIVGLSLGMTNAILKRLAQKGLLTIRKVNNRNIRYVVSPQGVEAITRRSYRYFKRTIKNVVYYREVIELFIRDIKRKKFAHLVLVGLSDLDFIVEHACVRYELDFVKSKAEDSEKVFYLYSESYIPDEDNNPYQKDNSAFLQDLLMWQQ